HHIRLVESVGGVRCIVRTIGSTIILVQAVSGSIRRRVEALRATRAAGPGSTGSAAPSSPTRAAVAASGGCVVQHAAAAAGAPGSAVVGAARGRFGLRVEDARRDRAEREHDGKPTQ